MANRIGSTAARLLAEPKTPSSVTDFKSWRILGLHFAPIINSGSGDVGLPKPFLDFADVGNRAAALGFDSGAIGTQDTGGATSNGSRGVSISNRRSRSLHINTKPKRGSLSAFQPSKLRRLIVVVIARSKSAPGSSRRLSMTCHCSRNTANHCGVVDFS